MRWGRLWTAKRPRNPDRPGCPEPLKAWHSGTTFRSRRTPPMWVCRCSARRHVPRECRPSFGIAQRRVSMRTYDFSPLFRSTVGFDRVSRHLDAALEGSDSGQGYTPSNITKVGEDKYRITMQVAGFTRDDAESVLQE